MSDNWDEIRLPTDSPIERVVHDAFVGKRVYAFCEDGTLWRCDDVTAERPRWERYILPEESEPPTDYPPPPPYIPE